MNLWEAIAEAKKGKTIRQLPSRHCAKWNGVELRWSTPHCSDTVDLHKGVTDCDWEVVPPEPPKEYDFGEAYKMMKAGRWMRPLGYKQVRRWAEGPGIIGRWQAFWEFDGSRIENLDGIAFTPCEIEWKWAEHEPGKVG